VFEQHQAACVSSEFSQAEPGSCLSIHLGHGCVLLLTPLESNITLYPSQGQYDSVFIVSVGNTSMWPSVDYVLSLNRIVRNEEGNTLTWIYLSWASKEALLFFWW
jgi:hypothetical protein